MARINIWLLCPYISYWCNDSNWERIYSTEKY